MIETMNEDKPATRFASQIRGQTRSPCFWRTTRRIPRVFETPLAFFPHSPPFSPPLLLRSTRRQFFSEDRKHVSEDENNCPRFDSFIGITRLLL